MSDRRPRLVPGLRVVEQVYQGEQIFVVRDPVAHRHFRLRPAEVTVLRSFDGRRTAAEIAAALAEHGLGVSAAAVEKFAAKLTNLGLVERSLSDRTTLELERLRAERRRRRSLFRGELFRIRWSIGDPDAMFNRVLPYVRWCFTPAFVAASVLLFTAYFGILALTWDDFSRAVAGQYSLHTITFASFVVLWFTGLVIFGVHELGHGFTCKYFGGEVHEMGFMMLYLEPAFYCNVNDAWGFPELRARIWVTAAGSWIQVVLASLAAVVWLVAVPGTLVSDVAVAAMLLGGITTVVTNMNPLIPLDGYFALSDYLEITNLRIRAFAYLGWWVKRFVLRLELPEPTATERERRVFLLYGLLAFVYIGTLLSLVAAFVFGWMRELFGVLGAVLFVAAVLYSSRRRLREWKQTLVLALRPRASAWRSAGRRRAMLAAALLIVLIAGLVPRPLVTTGPFTSVPTRMLTLVAPDSGVVTEVSVAEGARVAPGAPLARMVDYALERERVARERAVDSLGVAEARARGLGMPAAAERLAMERSAAAASLAALTARLDALTLRARAAGSVMTHRPHDLLGRRLGSGDTLLTLGDLDSVEVRIALAGGGASRVRSGQPVRLLSYADPSRPVRATVAGVSTVAPGSVEASVHLSGTSAWRPGVRGEASVELGRSNMIGALWWAVRKRVRSDLLM